MADLDIARSLRWHDPGRFNGYVLSQHVAGTPVDVVNLRDALPVVKNGTFFHLQRQHSINVRPPAKRTLSRCGRSCRAVTRVDGIQHSPYLLVFGPATSCSFGRLLEGGLI
jgi:hypothetical protein